MLSRAVEFLPILRAAQPDTADPLRVGLRPFRSAGVRLQIHPSTRIVHNYGHGGAGVTLWWGCAEEVADIADTIASRESPTDEITNQVEAIGNPR